MITCPECSEDNPIQKFCGNCGAKLLIDGVKLSSTPQDKTNSPGTHSISKWIKAIIIFLLIWIVGGVVLSIILGMANISDKYAGAICFAIAVLVFLEFITRKGYLNEEKGIITVDNINIEDK